MKRADQDRAHKPDQDRAPKPKTRRLRSPREPERDTEGMSATDAAKLKRYRES